MFQGHISIETIERMLKEEPGQEKRWRTQYDHLDSCSSCFSAFWHHPFNDVPGIERRCMRITIKTEDGDVPHHVCIDKAPDKRDAPDGSWRRRPATFEEIFSWVGSPAAQ